MFYESAIILDFCFIATAAFAAPEVQLHVESSKHIIAPKDSATAGAEWVEFSVQITNSSARNFWLAGYTTNIPFYNIYTRTSQNSQWKNYGMGFCGTGASIHQLVPNSSHLFSVAVPASYIGQQLQVRLLIYDAETNSKPVEIVSEPTIIH